MNTVEGRERHSQDEKQKEKPTNFLHTFAVNDNGAICYIGRACENTVTSNIIAKL